MMIKISKKRGNHWKELEIAIKTRPKPSASYPRRIKKVDNTVGNILLLFMPCGD